MYGKFLDTKCGYIEIAEKVKLDLANARSAPL